jgi:pyruvate dehydrogenase phosphatase
LAGNGSEAIGERLPQWYDMGSTATSARLYRVALLEPRLGPLPRPPMRRAAVQAVRSVRRPCLRKYGLAYRALHVHHHHKVHHRASPVLLASSMQFRAITGALVAAAVASGAFYAYNGNQSASKAPSPADHARALSTSASSAAPEHTRRALVVGQGELYTGTITGTGPISKDTDESGRKVLEMLDPDQATAKLRKNEESWLVGRGQGVVRYDVVQSKQLLPFWYPPRFLDS